MTNPDEAPVGYRAVEIQDLTCEGCDLWLILLNSINSTERFKASVCGQNPCHANFRSDSSNVKFVRKTDVMSSCLHAMGSLGEVVDQSEVCDV